MEQAAPNIFKYEIRAGERYMVRVEHLGRQIRHKGFLTPEQAQDWLDLLRADFVNEKYFPERIQAPPLRDVAEQWLKDAARKTLRHNTLRSYKANLEQHVLPVLGDVPFNQIDRALIADFLARKRRERPEKPYSRDALRLMLAPLSVLFSDCLDAGRFGVDVNPCLRPGRLIQIKKRKKPLKAYTPKEETTILTACRRRRPDQYALFCTLFWAGLRPGEAWALTPGDLDLRKRLIHVSKTFTDGELHDTPKTGQTRFVEIPPKLVPVLRTTRKKGPLVFPGREDGHRHQSQWNRRIWNPVIQAAGVPRYPPYATRHTYATRQLQAGCSLQWLMHQMGHSSIKVTVDTYGHLTHRNNKRRAL